METTMERYKEQTELHMKRLFQSLSEKDRRRYAAVEAEKLGHGGVGYISELFDVDPKTIRQGRADLELETDPAAGRIRKKGGTTADPRSHTAGRRRVSESHR
jgi:hypothetical protein